MEPMSAIDWTDLYNSYAGQWVALEDDEKTVIASADSLDELLKIAEEEGEPDPIVHRVPERPEMIVGSALE